MWRNVPQSLHVGLHGQTTCQDRWCRAHVVWPTFFKSEWHVKTSDVGPLTFPRIVVIPLSSQELWSYVKPMSIALAIVAPLGLPSSRANNCDAMRGPCWSPSQLSLHLDHHLQGQRTCQNCWCRVHVVCPYNYLLCLIINTGKKKERNKN